MNHFFQILKRTAIVLAIACFFPEGITHAWLLISSALPNTTDDASLEYVEIANSSCEMESLSGYTLSDVSGKIFSFPITFFLPIWWSGKFLRPETKISLNNDTETLFLWNNSWVLIDSLHWNSSIKGAPVFHSPLYETPICPIPEASDSESIIPEWENSEWTRNDSPEESLPTPPDALIIESPETFSPEYSEETWEQIPSNDAWETQTTSFSGETLSESGEVVGDTSENSLDATGSTLSDILIPPQESVAPLLSESSTARATPEFLRIVDSNGDHRFDRVEVTFSEALTGSVMLSGVFLYSDSGGLFQEKVSTVEGYFSEASISGSVVTFILTGSILPKDSLRINASTTSQFRLKSTAEFGLQTLSSNLPVIPFGLTTSFDGYSQERISFFPIPPPPPVNSSPTYVTYVNVSGPSVPVSSDSGSTSIVNTGAVILSKSPSTPRKSPKKTPPSKTSETLTSSTSKGIYEFPKNIAVIPSAGVDLLPSGKFRYECASTNCSVGFRVENPPKTWGYWLFPDGRKRFWTTTGTVLRIAGRVQLAYALETPERILKIPIDLTIVPFVAPSAKKPISTSVKNASKTVAASKESSVSKKSSPKPKVAEFPPKALSGSTFRPIAPESNTFPVALLTVSALTLWGLFGTWIFRRRSENEG